MTDVNAIFWRAVTPADFFNIERSRNAAPASGGGQSYFSISFSGLTHEELGGFLDVEPPSRIESARPTVLLDQVAVINDPGVVAPLEFAPRYQNLDESDRYRISRQNRQYQARHPAWLPERGFPRAPDDVVNGDPRMPDLTYLKIYVAKLSDGAFRAGFFNSPDPPAGFPERHGLERLFAPFDIHASAGVIELGAGAVDLATWVDSVSLETEGLPPELVEAIESTRVAAGKRPRGQGFRVDPKARRAVELRAMELAVERLGVDGWTVTDVSANRPYDLDCVRGAETLRVEVKGTTSGGASVLLTPGEVKHARERADVALIVVRDVALVIDEVSGDPVGVGGVVEVVDPWEIDAQGQLIATGYEYRRVARLTLPEPESG